MTNKSTARKYRRTTLRRLDTLAGNQCAAPDCERKLIARDGESITSKICHIEAASSGGVRWNSNMDDNERRHFNNLILLCDECHTIVDNEDNVGVYSVSLLKQWKKQHEDIRTYSILNQQTSLLSMVIDEISKLEFESDEDNSAQQVMAFEIEPKISHNAIKRNKSLIDEYKVFYTKVNSLYQLLEEQGSFKKENLLRNIRCLYVRVKGKYIGADANPMQKIRDNADNIFEDVQEELLAMVERSSSNFKDDISFGMNIIMVDAFMRCKILEEPPIS